MRERYASDSFAIARIPEDEFRDGPLDGVELGSRERASLFERAAACEGDVGNVVGTFETGYRVEFVGETLVNGEETGTLDNDIHHRAGTANRIFEEVDTRRACFERGSARECPPHALEEVIRFAGLTAL